MSATEYDVTMRHDHGTITIRTGAPSPEDAARLVCTAEGAPSRSVVNVREVTDE